MKKISWPGRGWKAACMRCGFWFPSLELKKEWTGLWVCKKCIEPRHEQTLIRVQGERAFPTFVSKDIDEFIAVCNVATRTSYADVGTADCMRADDISISYSLASEMYITGHGDMPRPATPALVLSPLVVSNIGSSTATVTYSTSGGVGPYTYMYIVGSSGIWTSVGTSTTINLTGLAPGNNIVQVKVTDSQGRNSTQSTTVITPTSNNITINFNSTLDGVSVAGTENSQSYLLSTAYSTGAGVTFNTTMTDGWPYSHLVYLATNPNFAAAGVPMPSSSSPSCGMWQGELVVSGAGSWPGATGLYTTVQMDLYDVQGTYSGYIGEVYWKNAGGTEYGTSSSVNWVSPGGGSDYFSATLTAPGAGLYFSRFVSVSAVSVDRIILTH